MSNKYVDFITDDDLLECIEVLYVGYRTALASKNLKGFMKNKIDPIKFTFDAKILDLNMEKYIEREVVRQADKTISNYIGDFHEQVLGKITGFKNLPVGSGIDIISEDGKLIAEIKNKHNTVKGENNVDIFTKLKTMLEDPHTDAEEAFYVRIIDTKSQLRNWELTSKKIPYSDENIKVVSGDKFYELLTGQSDAFAQLCSILPLALDEFISSLPEESRIKTGEFRIIEEIKRDYFNSTQENISDKELLTQLFRLNFSSYIGFSDFKIKN